MTASAARTAGGASTPSDLTTGYSARRDGVVFIAVFYLLDLTPGG
jgi:hypothetical protein